MSIFKMRRDRPSCRTDSFPRHSASFVRIQSVHSDIPSTTGLTHMSDTNRFCSSRRIFVQSTAAGSLLAMGQSLPATDGPPPNELTNISASEIAVMIRERQVSSVEVVEAYLERIQELNPRINAVVQISKNARRAAERADKIRPDAGQKPLHGVPVTIKDEFETAGLTTTLGTLGLKNNVPKQDATVVKRFKAAGAIILGKTNVPELLWANETDNLVYGRTNNPYSLDRTPGGSSGGEASIIASGGSPLGVGTDAAGSIRTPSHYCGIAGLKATWGLIPMTGSLFRAGPILSRFDSPGPLARYVRDLALALPILAGPDNLDPNVSPIPVGDYHRVDISKLRIAFYTNDGIAEPTQTIQQSVRKAASALSKVVNVVEEKHPPLIDRVFELAGELINPEVTKLLRRSLSEFETKKIHKLLQGAFPPGEAWSSAKSTPGQNASVSLSLDAHERWSEFRSKIAEFFTNFDAIICPPEALPALRHGETWKEEVFRGISYSLLGNLTGAPTAVVRCGTSPEGLPLGVQVIAPNWRDDIALAVAEFLEKEFGGWQPPKLLPHGND